MSPFYARLDLLTSSHPVVKLRSEIISCYHENDLFLGELLKVQDAMMKLKTKLQEFESVVQDLEGMIVSNVKTQDTAIVGLEALAMPPLQFDMSWPLDHDLL